MALFSFPFSFFPLIGTKEAALFCISLSDYQVPLLISCTCLSRPQFLFLNVNNFAILLTLSPSSSFYLSHFSGHLGKNGLIMDDELQLDGAIVSAIFDSSLDIGVVSTTSGTIWYIDWDERTSIRLISGHNDQVSFFSFLVYNHHVYGYVGSNSFTCPVPWPGCSVLSVSLTLFLCLHASTKNIRYLSIYLFWFSLKVNGLIFGGNNGNFMASCASDGSMRLWNTESFEQTLQFLVLNQVRLNILYFRSCYLRIYTRIHFHF